MDKFKAVKTYRLVNGEEVTDYQASEEQFFEDLRDLILYNDKSTIHFSHEALGKKEGTIPLTPLEGRNEP